MHKQAIKHKQAIIGGGYLFTENACLFWSVHLEDRLFSLGLGRYGQQPIRYVFDTDLANTIVIRFHSRVHN